MKAPMRPLSEITEQAIALLAREIGIADTIRFISQFSSGYGNYTEEREALFGTLTLADIFEELEQSRGTSQSK